MFAAANDAASVIAAAMSLMLQIVWGEGGGMSSIGGNSMSSIGGKGGWIGENPFLQEDCSEILVHFLRMKAC